MAIGQAKRVRFKGWNQLDTVEGKSNETGLVWRTDRVVWRGVTLARTCVRGPSVTGAGPWVSCEGSNTSGWFGGA